MPARSGNAGRSKVATIQWPASIFLVDDDEFILRALRRLLRGKGFEISFFVGARRVLDACREAPPDVIVTDYYMPRRDGLDLLAEVQRRFPRVGRIILTGGFLDSRMQAAMESGLVQVLLPKPWKLRLMMEAFEALRSGDIPKVIEWKGTPGGETPLR